MNYYITAIFIAATGVIIGSVLAIIFTLTFMLTSEPVRDCGLQPENACLILDDFFKQ